MQDVLPEERMFLRDKGLLMSDSQSLIKAHAAAVRANGPKILRLKREYGLTISDLAKRFTVSESVIKGILKSKEHYGSH